MGIARPPISVAAKVRGHSLRTHTIADPVFHEK